MLERRSLFSAGTTAATALGALFGSRQAEAKTGSFDIEPRGSEGRLERMPTLDMEGIHDFTSGFRLWHAAKGRRLAGNRVQKVFEKRGLDPRTKMPIEEVAKILEEDKILTTTSRAWLSNQQVTWKSIQDHYHAHADEYRAEMEAYDNRGPGTLAGC